VGSDEDGGRAGEERSVIIRKFISITTLRSKTVSVRENTLSENNVSSSRIGRHSDVQVNCIVDVKVNIVDILRVVVSSLNWNNKVSSNVGEEGDQISIATKSSFSSTARNTTYGNVSNSTVGVTGDNTNEKSSSRNSRASKVYGINGGIVRGVAVVGIRINDTRFVSSSGGKRGII